MSWRRRVAFESIPDEASCLTTSSRDENLTPPAPDMYSEERAGLWSIPTGGSCAESPTRMRKQSVPLRTNLTRSASRSPLPNTAPPFCEASSIPMRDTSSTMNTAFLALLGPRANVPVPSSPKLLCLYMLLWMVAALLPV